MNTAEMNSALAQITGGPAEEVVEVDRNAIAHFGFDQVCMLFDTETTGIGADAQCWQIGTVKLYKNRSNNKLFASYEEILLPYA